MHLRPSFHPARFSAALAIVFAAALTPATISRAELVWPPCVAPACSDPADFASYLFSAPGEIPGDYTGGNRWKFEPVSGMDIVGAWQFSTGRPDTRVAILDSGILWNARDVARKVWLNVAELPTVCPRVPVFDLDDCNGDGVVSVDDFPAPDANGNGILDAQDILRAYSNGIDDDGNGYVDDIAGWDFAQRDNDPFDAVHYGHGTGEAFDQIAEANNGDAFPGVAPSAFFVPLKVADSFVGVDTEFAEAVVYATDRGVDVISEALGTVTASSASQDAIDYAYHRGIPLIASAADEQSRHHNAPANFEHTIWVNSIRDADGTFASSKIGNVTDYTVQNGCTNHGGRAWVAISSTSCSSEATGRSGGIALLLISHAKNLIDRGLFAPYPGLSTPFSAEEVRQLFRRAAEDVDHSVKPPLTIPLLGNVLQNLLSGPGFAFRSSNFPTQAGWDQFTGWGRPNVSSLLRSISVDTMPPEVDLSGSLAWFDTIDPVRTPSVDVAGSIAAMRTGGGFTYALEVGCGVQPTSFRTLASQASPGRIDRAVLGRWNPGATAADCGFDPAATLTEPDAHTVQLRLTATDSRGNVGIDLRTVAIHHDATQRFAPRILGASGESSPVLADVDRDGVQEIVLATSDGALHVMRGSDGSDIPGFPVYTRAHPVPIVAGNGYATKAVRIPHEAVVASVAADDVDGDGRIELLMAGTDGGVYLIDDQGKPRRGFPVTTNPAFSGDATLDVFNDADPGIASAPTLADLDPPGTPGHGTLEIIVGGMDGHLYAWRADGSPVSGFPVRLADDAKVDLDPATGKLTPKPGSGARDRLTKILSSPTVGDLDGDGAVEIVIATNEEYQNASEAGFAADSTLLGQLLQASQIGLDLGDFRVDTTGRVYAVQHDGAQHAGGPFVSGWPVRVPLMMSGVLPTVATGTPGSAAIADIDGSGRRVVAIFGAAGPVLLLNPDGTPTLGSVAGKPRVLPIDFPNAGFPQVPPTAGSGDAPFFGALGSGAFGDITGDGLPEYIAPTAGIRTLLDVAVPGQQEFGDHSIGVWNPAAGMLLPAFPRKMDDMQFLSSPSLADVDGDGVAEVVQGSGGYLIHAFRSNGSEPQGWPKFTHGWMIPSPVAGDIDGDGLIEIAANSREGKLFVWDTPAPAVDSAIPWQGFARDRRNSGNLQSGVSATAVAGDPLLGLAWTLRSVDSQLRDRIATTGGVAGFALRSSISAAALRLAVFGLETGRFELVTILLPWIDFYLRTPAIIRPIVADLDAQFTSGVARAVHQGVSQIACAAGDTACANERARAQQLVATGDAAMTGGQRLVALRAWARALQIVATH